jgi:hypothetical protein
MTSNRRLGNFEGSTSQVLAIVACDSRNPTAGARAPDSQHLIWIWTMPRWDRNGGSSLPDVN